MTTITETSYSSEGIQVDHVHDARQYRLDRRSIVVNLAPSAALIDEHLGGYIPPVSSTMLSEGVAVTGDLLCVISESGGPVSERYFRELGWTDFLATASQSDKDAPVLLKSPQETAGAVDLDMSQILHDPTAPEAEQRHEVKTNLWFAPAGTDCGIHREHPFVETHTQIAGVGRMQKFKDESHDSVFEDVILSPGLTQPSIFGRFHEDRLVYPWHQYKADTDAVWLAVEYHAPDL